MTTAAAAAIPTLLDTVQAVARALAALDGGTVWTAEAPEEYADRRILLRCGYLPEAHVNVETSSRTKPGRFVLAVYPDRALHEFWPFRTNLDDAPREITVASTSAPDRIAAEIRRRLMPGFRARHAEAPLRSARSSLPSAPPPSSRRRPGGSGGSLRLSLRH